MTRRVAVRGIIVEDGKLLCFKLFKKPGSNPVDFWCVPGGGVDEGEPLLPALEREMIEETGIKPTIGNLLYVQQFILNHKEHLELFFHITNTSDYSSIDLQATTHGNIEVAEYKFVDPTKHKVLPKFLGTEPLTDLGSQTTKFFSYL